jgi:hypothetical protein
LESFLEVKEQPFESVLLLDVTKQIRTSSMVTEKQQYVDACSFCRLIFSRTTTTFLYTMFPFGKTGEARCHQNGKTSAIKGVPKRAYGNPVPCFVTANGSFSMSAWLLPKTCGARTCWSHFAAAAAAPGFAAAAGVGVGSCTQEIDSFQIFLPFSAKLGAICQVANLSSLLHSFTFWAKTFVANYRRAFQHTKSVRHSIQNYFVFQSFYKCTTVFCKAF